MRFAVKVRTGFIISFWRANVIKKDEYSVLTNGFYSRATGGGEIKFYLFNSFICSLTACTNSFFRNGFIMYEFAPYSKHLCLSFDSV